jgi:hypothetical protein
MLAKRICCPHELHAGVDAIPGGGGDSFWMSGIYLLPSLTAVQA